MEQTIVSRRDFGLALVTSATAATLPTGAAAEDKTKLIPMEKAAPTPMPEEPREIPEHLYLLGAVLRHYPDKRLDEAAITGIMRDIVGDLAKGKVLSNFPLKNSDEPGYVFQAYRSD